MDSWMDEQGQGFGMWPPGSPEGRMGIGALGFPVRFLAFLVRSGLGKVLGISHPSPPHALGKRDDPKGVTLGKERRPNPPLSASPRC